MSRRRFGSACIGVLSSLLIATGSFAAANKAPSVTSFDVPPSAPSTIPVLAFSGSDPDGTVAGYLITETPVKPSASASGWSATRPAQYTTPSTGTVTLYGWVKDNKGAISSAATDTLAICFGDVYPGGFVGWPSIQACIDGTASGGTCAVCDGVYQERVNFGGKALTVTSVNGPAVTVIEADGGELAGPVVTFAANEGRGSVLNGFGVRKGHGFPGTSGSGVYCVNSSPTISSCVIEQNVSDAYGGGGGGVSCSGASSSPLITGCVIRGNATGGYSGGGILASGGASPIIEDCEISGNVNRIDAGGGPGGGVYCGGNTRITRCRISGNDSGGGAGVWISDGAPVIQDCTISGNTSTGAGNGVYASPGSAPTISGCEIVDNGGPASGSGIFSYNATLVVAGSVVSRNSAEYQGGGISVVRGTATITDSKISDNWTWSLNMGSKGAGLHAADALVHLTNCIVAANGRSSPATQFGGGIMLEGNSGTSSIVNCTVSGNTATSGGGFYDADLYTEIINSIFYFNVGSAPLTKEIYVPYDRPSPLIFRCDVAGIGNQGDNIDLDPRFVSTDGADRAGWHISADSPCIGQGDTARAPAADIDGEARLTDGFADIGADEYVNPAPEVVATSPAGGATGVALGVTVTVAFGEDVAPGVNFGGITLICGGSSISVSRQVAGSVLAIDPVPTALPKQAKCEVTVPAGAVDDLEGSPLAAAYRFSFTTARR